MNKAVLIGNLTKDPENRTTPNGTSVTTFTVAVQRTFNREEADFVPIVTWRGLADNCAKYLVKGQKVAVLGRIQTRSYEDQNNQKRYITEIIADDVEFLSKPSGASSQSSNAGFPPEPNMGEEDLFANEMGDMLMDDEELPF